MPDSTRNKFAWNPQGLRGFVQRECKRYLWTSPDSKKRSPDPEKFPEHWYAEEFDPECRYHGPVQLVRQVFHLCDEAEERIARGDRAAARAALTMAVGILVGSGLNISQEDCLRALSSPETKT